ncbi:MAG: SDR family oxidoreductase [Burkholderiaceae bacterium]
MSERPKALITGAGTGVGAATALELTRRGYDVLINYRRSADEADSVAEQCRQAGGQPLLVQGDVAEDADCRRLVQSALDTWGRLDALVNNAGVTVFKPGQWDGLEPEDFQRLYAVNTIGTFQMVRAARAALKDARGAIVNVSSIAGALGIGSSAAYIAAKGAVNSLTLHMARELAPEIRVNAVCPGLITTRWFVDGLGQEAFEKIRANYESTRPLATACSAEDVADAIVWLVTGARTTTGELVLLDSGTHL